MNTTLGDQFHAASKRFSLARLAYEKELAGLKELEQELLNYTDGYQALPEAAEYIGNGTWKAFDCIFSAMQSSDCWQYACTFGGKDFLFEEVSEAVAFLAGYKTAADQHKESKANHLTQPE